MKVAFLRKFSHRALSSIYNCEQPYQLIIYLLNSNNITPWMQ